MKYITLVTAFLVSLSPFIASAQNAMQGQTTQQELSGTASAVISPGAVNIVSNGAADSPLKATSIDTSGTQTIKSTGQAIAPGVYNSSGQYTCFGGASAAVGWPGAAIGGGMTIGQDDCYRLHIMDKAQARASAAAKAAAEAKDADVAAMFAKQSQAYTALWDAGFCQFKDGYKMMVAAGLKCPGVQEQETVSSDKQIRQRQIGY